MSRTLKFEVHEAHAKAKILHFLLTVTRAVKLTHISPNGTVAVQSKLFNLNEQSNVIY